MTEPTPAATSAAAATMGAAPAAPPRDLTPRARRTAWTAPHVRFWWLIAVALLLGMAYLTVMQTLEWSDEVRLVKSGTVVDAVVYDAGGKLKNMPISPLANVDLTYKFNNQTYKVTGELPERRNDLRTGQTISIRIDPKNPKTWTNRTTPPPLIDELFAPLLLLPALVVSVLAAFVLRRRVTNLWVTGEARQAVVVDTKQTPLAPLSHVVRCTLADGADKRLITVYLPHRAAGKPAKGQAIWLVTHPKNPQRALAAAAFL